MRSGRLLALFLGLTAIGSLLAATGSDAVVPLPVWRISATSYPTNFVPGAVGTKEDGPGYSVVVRNVGGAAAEGEFRIDDTLPQGTSFSGTAEPMATYGPQQASQNMTCATAGITLSCVAQGPVNPGEEATLFIPVEVPLGTSGVLTDEASVELGGAAKAATVVHTQATPLGVGFSFLDNPAGAFGGASLADGSAADQAGSHPYQLTVGMSFNAEGAQEPGDTLHVPSGGISGITGALPQGVVVDPQATPTCREGLLVERRCPDESQVGIVRVSVSPFSDLPNVFFSPLYNMEAPPGTPAVLGFEAIEGIYIHLIGGVRSDGDYGLSAEAANVPAKVGISGAEVILWGDPSDPSHDSVRGRCLMVGGSCGTEELDTAFLSLPSSCSSAALETAISITSWDREAATTRYANADPSGAPLAIGGCSQLGFEPTITVAPSTQSADSPTGLEVGLHQPQDEDVEGLGTANLRDVRVALPAGVAVNPSAASGLAACSEQQIGYAPQGTKLNFTKSPQTCPAAAKIGSVKVSTPLLANPLPGFIYLASPYANPFSTLLGLYLAIEDPQTGIVAKLAGRVDANPTTGQLTATFAENPELPLEDIDLTFFGGSRATLTTPISCGAYTTTTDLTPWSTPEGADAHPTSAFGILSSNSGAGGCPGSEAQAPNQPTFSAGTESPLSGVFSPFILRVDRKDGTQHIAGIETTLPEGLLGKLAGIPYCPESAIALARSRDAAEEGKEELSSPACPASSEVGTVNVTAGSGTTPFPVTGHAYLAGPYKGAPLSLVVIVPAVAGPFDLGSVVDRVALNVGEYDARIHAVADPLPTILDGVPLDVRSIELRLNRSNFTLNPTSCEAMSITGTVSTQTGQTAPVENRFQVGECGHLAFKPRIAVSLKGGTKRAAHPALKAVVSFPKKGRYANIGRAQVSLPHAEFLDQSNIGTVCTRPQLATRTCPAKSIYGRAEAWTPLLDKPLKGNVYLAGGFGYKLPALVAELNGQIRVLLAGKIDTDKQNGIRTTFESVPDAPIEKFMLEMKGGAKYGLLVNSENICKKRQAAGAAFVGSNGKSLSLSATIANSCKDGGKKHKSK